MGKKPELKKSDRRGEGKLFRLADSYYGNVTLNFFASHDTEWPAYASAFWRAASELVLKFKQIEKPGYRDTEALPIVFLYRHAFELYWKGIIITGRKLLLMSGQKIIEEGPMKTHKFSDLMPRVRQIFTSVGWTGDTGSEDISNIQAIEKLIREFEKIDPVAVSFKYPGDELPGNFTFNFIEFSELMEKLLNLLDGACTGLDAMFGQLEDNMDASYYSEHYLFDTFGQVSIPALRHSVGRDWIRARRANVNYIVLPLVSGFNPRFPIPLYSVFLSKRHRREGDRGAGGGVVPAGPFQEFAG